jgi:hypothetical protein
MSTVLTRGRSRRGSRRDPEAGRQASLFSQVVQPLPREVDVPREDPVPSVHQAPCDDDRHDNIATAAGPTLDEAMSELWDGLLAGTPAACPVCREPMQPRHSAGAGVVGGRCPSCASTLA